MSGSNPWSSSTVEPDLIGDPSCRLLGNEDQVSTFIPLLSRKQLERLPQRAREVVEYRKSGLSLNHIQGCPLDCAYSTGQLIRSCRQCDRTPSPCSKTWTGVDCATMSSSSRATR